MKTLIVLTQKEQKEIQKALHHYGANNKLLRKWGQVVDDTKEGGEEVEVITSDDYERGLLEDE